MGGWTGPVTPAFVPSDVAQVAQLIRQTVFVVVDPTTGRRGVVAGGSAAEATEPSAWRIAGVLPPLFPEWLGDRNFTETHGVRFPYVAGEMANGIATTTMVIEMARNGYLGFFGAAGLSVDRVGVAIGELTAALGRDGTPWGSNLIHSPNEPALEDAVAALYLARGVRKVSASAYMSLTPAIVR